ncbi:AraC-type DNA-binding protein [Parapedobacter composti]|uniref:AraC-type DNA-binding protein n=1 Tax=Parapedobacter composti TaxID=623281 RepID=A0A1I1JX96_9SPHI|nr:AraC family transcriptional regulator [Parapedobacter composti]SFC52612.1 AraC-type DNA-binding protein [Parapedobacter composti]
MKPHFHLVPRSTEYPYLSRQHTLPNFGTVWHYHPELELHYVVRGEGVRFVGDNISNFDAGELLLLGENLPHMWRCNKRYFQGNPNITAEAVVVQFLADFMGRDFLRKPEAAAIHALYERARYGLVIHGSTKKQVVTLMRESVQAEGLSRLMLIFNILHVLADSKEMTQIASGWTTHRANKDEADRINKVYHYILSNYRNEITLEEISAVAHLSVTSFCRYFKMMTKKTFRDFLIEVRISHAKRMLIEDSISTTEAICFECGFNNRSNFFRHFKRITGCTPVEYRSKYLYENVFV